MTKKKQLAFEEHEVETFFIGDYAFHIGERFVDEAIAATTAPYPHGVASSSISAWTLAARSSSTNRAT